MRNLSRAFLVLITTFQTLAVAVAAPLSEAEFHAQVTALYTFQPHKLTSAEMKAKPAALDKFWDAAKADPKGVLPLLRKELTSPASPSFFSYDGSKLLLSLSQDAHDRAIALLSIPKVDLQDVEPTDYLKTIHWFAKNDFDTRDAAFHILADPKFKAFIPQHALTLAQNFSLIYMLFPMDDSAFLPDLVAKLSTEAQVESQKTLLLALWYTATKTGIAAINEFAENKQKSAEATAYAKMLANRKAPLLGYVTTSSEKSLREERKKLMRRPISDEALSEFDSLTAKILAKL